jgi:hypothetical protein
MTDPAASSLPPPDAVVAGPQDFEQLRLLSIFHYVLGAITGLFSLFPLIHLGIGILLVTGRFEPREPGAEMAGWMFIGIAACFIVCGLGLAVSMLLTGRYLGQRRRPLFCLIVAAIECMIMPFGTVLGVFTLIALTRPQIRALFPES